jgi:hypothetical protein
VLWIGRDRCGDIAAPIVLFCGQLLLLTWLASCGAPH